jgi:hypothetical protein
MNNRASARLLKGSPHSKHAIVIGSLRNTAFPQLLPALLTDPADKEGVESELANRAKHVQILAGGKMATATVAFSAGTPELTEGNELTSAIQFCPDDRHHEGNVFGDVVMGLAKGSKLSEIPVDKILKCESGTRVRLAKGM